MFYDSIKDELEELTASPFGSTLVATIGRAYHEHAMSELSTIQGISVSFLQASRYVSSGMTIAQESISAALTANQMQKIQKKALQRQIVINATASTATATATASASTSSEGGTSGTTASADNGMKINLTPEEEKLIEAKIEKLSDHMFTVM
jgi:hypothetical protein